MAAAFDSDSLNKQFHANKHCNQLIITAMWQQKS